MGGRVCAPPFSFLVTSAHNQIVTALPEKKGEGAILEPGNRTLEFWCSSTYNNQALYSIQCGLDRILKASHMSVLIHLVLPTTPRSMHCF